jgi:hypothetical protein
MEEAGGKNNFEKIRFVCTHYPENSSVLVKSLEPKAGAGYTFCPALA